MHLTTIVSLLAAGATAAPAGLVDPTTKIATPALLIRRQEATPTGNPSFRDHVAEQDRKAAAEKDPLDTYLETFDGEGEWDQEAHDKALDRYNKALESEDAEFTEPEHTSNSTSVVARAVEVPTTSAVTVNTTTASDVKAAKATVDPLDTYLETFEEDSYDEKAQDEALDHYLETFETHSAETTIPNSTTTSAAPVATSSEAAADPLAGLMSKETAEPNASNATSEEAVAPKNETSKGPLDQMMHDFDFKKLMGKEPKAEAQKNETSVEPSAAKNETSTEHAAAKNETSSAAPATSSSSSDPLSGLTGGLPVGGLPVKRQAAPEVAGTESLESLNSLLSQRQVPELPEVPELESATEAFKRAVEDVKEVEKNTTSAAANETADDGFHGINKHMAKLDKLDALPVGGLPVKRDAFEEGARFDTRFQELDQEHDASPSFGQSGSQGQQGSFPQSGNAGQQQGAAQPTGMPVAQDQGFAAPSGTPVVQHQGFPSQAAPKPTAAPARDAPDGESRAGRDARMSRSVKAVYKTDKPSEPQAKPTGSPLDKLLVPLKRQQGESDAADAFEDDAAAEETKPSDAAAKPETEASPLADLFGSSEKKPARAGPPSESKPTGESKAESKPESQSESEEPSPLAGLMGESEKRPARGMPAEEVEQAPTEPKSEKPSFLDNLSSQKKPAGPPAAKPSSATKSAPAASSSAPASPLAGLMG